MASFLYYNDTADEAIELRTPQPMLNKIFAERFPGITGFRYDGYLANPKRAPL